jgi:S-adenosylmethionine synthetase
MIVVAAINGPPAGRQPVEIVERKGHGHPDTVCDLLSERLSVALSRHYLERFGRILHHNVDKCLLAAGKSLPRFGGGEVLAPIELHFAGRATLEARGERVPLDNLLHETVTGFFAERFRHLDPERHLRLASHIRPGSPELVDLFTRQQPAGAPYANDTSCGCGYAPLSELERIVLAVEQRLNAPAVKRQLPAAGEDIKVMGVRNGTALDLTISCAFIDRHLATLDDYLAAREGVAREARTIAEAIARRPVTVTVNSADDPEAGALYLTVTGSSAECGDDGMTGRGNRANGLITPMRPMTMEAVAGKNPVTHVGKLYNVGALLIAQRVIEALPDIEAAECRLVSRIGRPISEPQIAELRLSRHDGGPIEGALAGHAREIMAAGLHALPTLAERFARSELPIA